MSIEILRTAAEAARYCHGARLRGQRLGFVPTMGYLHEGHLSLIREAASRCDVVVASIFVNPTQFGPKEDLSRYPRDLEGDLAKCAKAGAHAVFTPDNDEMYPPGSQTWVDVVDVARGLCGDKRPGHFRGVATVVTKFFNIVRPDVALFGEKDFQQLRVIQILARDLFLGVEVVGMPTVREPDGLAMSSRNAYLSPPEREKARSLSRGLQKAQQMTRQGRVDVRELVGVVRAELEEAGVREDYVEVVDARTLRPLTRVTKDVPARALVAGYLGTTRLIDNLPLEV